MNRSGNTPIITVTEAVERFVDIYSPEPGNIVAIKRRFTDFAFVVYHKREKHWLRSCHSHLERVLKATWKSEGKEF